MAKSISRYLADISSTSGVLDGTLSTAAQTNITSLGTLSSLTVSGSAAMTLTTAAQPNITSVGTLSTLAMGGNITRTGDLSLDVSGNIILDAGSGNSISVSKDGTAFGIFEDSSTDFVIRSAIQDKDILFKGNDGGSTITALTLDMSAAGAATFNAGVTLSGHLDIAYAGANITWGTNYPAIGNIPSSQATLLGNNIKAGASNNTVIRHANGTDAGNFIALTYNKGVTFHTGIATTQNSEVAETTNERMRIDATGNVGIGTNGPAKPLHISSADNQPLRVESTDAYSGIELKDNGSATLPPLISALSNDFIFYGGHASSRPEIMRLDSSGNVNIGAKDYHTHNSTVDSLQIGYALNLYEDSYNTGTDNYVIWANNSYYATSGGNKYMRNDEASRIMQANGVFSYQNAAAGTADNSITFVTRMHISTTGDTTFTGASSVARLASHSYGTSLETTTADGSDNMSVSLDAGSGAGSNGRGAFWGCYGNEASGNGGNIVGQTGALGDYKLFGGGSAEELVRIDGTGMGIGHGKSTMRLIVGGENDASTTYNYTSGDGLIGIFGKQAYSNCDAHMEIATSSDIGWAPLYLNKFNWASGEDGRWIQFLMNSTGDSGTISYNGTDFVIAQGSDYRLKENIVDYSGGLAKLEELKVRTYNKKEGPSKDITQVGFIAHEAATANIPGFIMGEKDAMKTDEGGETVPDYQQISRDRLIPYLVSAIQELSAKVKELESK